MRQVFAADRFSLPGMMRSLRKLPLLVVGVAGVAVGYVYNGSLTPTVLVVGVAAGMLMITSCYAWLRLRFQSRSVQTVIATQGTQVVCLMLSLVLNAASYLYSAGAFGEYRTYYLIASVALAAIGAVYGKVYAGRRWKPKAGWLGEWARRGEGIPGDVLYEGFFSPSSKEKNRLARVLAWTGGSAGLVYWEVHNVNQTLMFTVTFLLVVWASFSMFANLVVRSHYVKKALQGTRLQIIADAGGMVSAELSP